MSEPHTYIVCPHCQEHIDVSSGLRIHQRMTVYLPQDPPPPEVDLLKPIPNPDPPNFIQRLLRWFI